ncbi:Aldo/keto reductase [Trichodelitschia bisporula]|uniref:Aldo/keto reductase n=1 Tax=Trichodelitschia bisporula TaxID=703511 RepID=A0A6G1HZW3_9PEZI|nr:Aldo/keto reductase [Trichodelitschia bisporula]
MSAIKLNTGASLPAIGLGTWQDPDAQQDAVAAALKAGYRHIDTATVYGTEKAVGEGLKKSGVPRSEVFITTKLWNNKHHPNDVEKALDQSLADLGTDYVDLWLIHWPVAFGRGEDKFPKTSDGKPITENIDFVDTYKAMEKCFKAGKAKAIGVSNFSHAEMERLLKETSVVPAVHQIERHPWLQQNKFVKWLHEKDIAVVAYSPFGNANPIYEGTKELGLLIQDPTLVEIGKKYGKSGAQTALAWGISTGCAVIPKSKSQERVKQNLEGDFKLSEEDVKKIEAIDKKARFNDSSADFGYDFFMDLDGKKK